MSTRLLRVDAPAPLLPKEAAVESREHVDSILRANGAGHLTDAVWRHGNALDPALHTRYHCHTLTGRAVACPTCGRSVPEVLVDGTPRPWCSCSQGDS